MRPRFAAGIVLTICPACSFEAGRQEVVYHLHSTHGWTKEAIAKRMGYDLKSISPILSIYRRRQEEEHHD